MHYVALVLTTVSSSVFVFASATKRSVRQRRPRAILGSLAVGEAVGMLIGPSGYYTFCANPIGLLRIVARGNETSPRNSSLLIRSISNTFQSKAHHQSSNTALHRMKKRVTRNTMVLLGSETVNYRGKKRASSSPSPQA